MGVVNLVEEDIIWGLNGAFNFAGKIWLKEKKDS
jgi:hypothetical protein